jgi:hypothetical protein
VAAGAVVGELRAKLAGERETFLRERLGSMSHLSEKDRMQIGSLLEEFVDRVVLNPTERLRGIPELRRKVQNLEAVRDLFRLDRDKS